MQDIPSFMELLTITLRKHNTDHDVTKANYLKVQSCKLYNEKYMIASTRIKNIENFTFMDVLVFMFINRKDNINC